MDRGGTHIQRRSMGAHRTLVHERRYPLVRAGIGTRRPARRQARRWRHHTGSPLAGSVRLGGAPDASQGHGRMASALTTGNTHGEMWCTYTRVRGPSWRCRAAPALDRRCDTEARREPTSRYRRLICLLPVVVSGRRCYYRHPGRTRCPDLVVGLSVAPPIGRSAIHCPDQPAWPVPPVPKCPSVAARWPSTPVPPVVRGRSPRTVGTPRPNAEAGDWP